MQDLKQLEAIVQARYQQQQQSLQRLLAEENRLRGELARLDDHLRNTRDHSEEGIPLRAIGADIIWQRWVGQRKSDLNTQLAKVLAIKEHHLVQVRTAYGKLLVVQELIEKEQRSTRKSKAEDQLARAIDQSLFN